MTGSESHRSSPSDLLWDIQCEAAGKDSFLKSWKLVMFRFSTTAKIICLFTKKEVSICTIPVPQCSIKLVKRELTIYIDKKRSYFIKFPKQTNFKLSKLEMLRDIAKEFSTIGNTDEPVLPLIRTRGSKPEIVTERTESIDLASSADISVLSDANEEWSGEDTDDIFECIDKLATFIELRGVYTEGIFRSSGDYLEQQKAFYQVLIHRDFTEYETVNVHILTGVLKVILQENPIIHDDTYSAFLAIAIKLSNCTEDEERHNIILKAAKFLSKKLPQTDKTIIRRVWTMIQHIKTGTEENKMSCADLASVFAPVFIRQPSTSTAGVDDIKTLTGLITSLFVHTDAVLQCIEAPQDDDEVYSNHPINNQQYLQKRELLAASSETTATRKFILYSGPPRLSNEDWDLLMTRSQKIHLSKHDVLLSEGKTNKELFLIVSGTASVYRQGVKIGVMSSGQFVGEMSAAGVFQVSASVIANNNCQVMRFKSSYLSTLFDFNHSLFFKFYWSQAQVIATRLLKLPLSLKTNLKKSKSSTSINSARSLANSNSGDSSEAPNMAKLEIFSPDGSSRWMDFALDETIAQMEKILRALLGENAELVETSHGRQICRLKPEWTVKELLIRAKYASTYQLVFTNQYRTASHAPSSDNQRSGTLSTSQSSNTTSNANSHSTSPRQSGSSESSSGNTATTTTTLSSSQNDFDLPKSFIISDGTPKPRSSRINSIVINQYPCKRKKKHGNLFILQNHLLHISKLFGLSTRSLLSYTDITKVNIMNDNPRIMLVEVRNESKPTKFQFSDTSSTENAKELIESLIQAPMTSPARRQSNQVELFTVQEIWAVVTKRYRIVSPTVIDIPCGAIVLIDPETADLLTSSRSSSEMSESGESTSTSHIIIPAQLTSHLKVPCTFKGSQIELPSDHLEVLPNNNYTTKVAVQSSLQQAGYQSIQQMPTSNDWSLLLLGGKLLKFKRGQTIVLEGTKMQRVYQIIRGHCSVIGRIAKSESQQLCEVSARWRQNITHNKCPLSYDDMRYCTLHPGDTFGEVGLLLATCATASVIAEGDPDEASEYTSVFMIEVSHLRDLFIDHPNIGGRFACYLQTVLERRLRVETENRVLEAVSHIAI